MVLPGWSAAPSGYTRLVTAGSGFVVGWCLNGKDDTTTDGSIAQGASNGSQNYFTMSAEVRAY